MFQPREGLHFVLYVKRMQGCLGLQEIPEYYETEEQARRRIQELTRPDSDPYYEGHTMYRLDVSKLVEYRHERPYPLEGDTHVDVEERR